MNIAKILKNTICLDLQSETKEDVIKELVDIMVQAGQIKDREAAVNAVMEREKKMSTGMQNGIAIPHGKTDSIDCLVAAMGIKREGLDFQSLDHQPAYIFIMTLSPANRTGPYIQFLAEISRLLSSKETRDNVLSATSLQELYAIISAT